MSLIIDSTVLIDASRMNGPAIEFLSAAADRAPLWSSVLVRTELLVGIRPDEDERVRTLFDLIRWQDVSPSIADLAGRLGARYRRTHSIGVPDLVIAATAIELGGTVATLNVRHFPMFPGLQPPY